jgi:hypothetical protein
VVASCEQGNKPSGSIKGRDFLEQLSDFFFFSENINSGATVSQHIVILVYEGVSKSFRTGRLERELQMVQLSAIRCGCNAIL